MSRSHVQIWGGHLEGDPNQLMVAFCAGRDVAALPMADAELLPYDAWTNRAHAIMLHAQGIITKETLAALLGALDSLEKDWEAGEFSLDPALEDIHVNSEAYITRLAGADVGGRLHTGRSRNDQIACDMRLYMRDALLAMASGTADLARTLSGLAADHLETPMPGFTHHQPAMITTWAHWLSSYVQGLCRDLERMEQTYRMVNRSPLGAAAAFGTSWPIDREMTARLLGFERVEHNTLDAIGSRGELEAQIAFVLTSLMNHLSVMAQDLILLSHPYWGMVTLPDAYVTGSSIMPQKRNPDLAEVIKGKTAWLLGMTSGLLAIPKGVMSGFNRDTQWSKYSVMDVLRECLPAPSVLGGVFQGMTVHGERMRAHLNTGFPAAADFADVLARTMGLPFRTCYNITADAVARSGDAGIITPEAARTALEAAGEDPSRAREALEALADPMAVLAWRSHTGAPAPEAVRTGLVTLGEELARREAFIAPAREALSAAHAQCRDFRP